MSFHIDATAARASMRRRAEAFRSNAQSAVREGATAAAATARATTAWGDKSGKTRNSIKVTGGASFRAKVTARGAAVFLENGTGQYGPKGSKYVIRATNAKALRFTVGGRTLFRRSVMHPGIKPTHFMRDAAEFARHAFVGACVQAMHSTVRA